VGPAVTILEAVRLWYPVALSLLSLVVALGMWAFRSEMSRVLASRAGIAEVRAVEIRCDAIEARVAAMEASMKTMPTGSQITDLLVKLEDVRGEMKAIRAHNDGARDLLTTLNRRVELIDQHLRSPQ
jgi:hypothetical protein